LAIGEIEFLGQGFGPKAIRDFLDCFVFVHDDISGIVCDPEENNLRSIRAFEKAGFKTVTIKRLNGENVDRRVVARERNVASDPNSARSSSRS